MRLRIAVIIGCALIACIGAWRLAAGVIGPVTTTQGARVFDARAFISTQEALDHARSALSMSHSPERTTLLTAWLADLGRRDSDAAQRFFNDIPPNDPAYRWLFAAWFRAWLEANAADAVRHARELTEPMRDEALLLAIDWFGAGSPEAARLTGELSEPARATRLVAGAIRMPPLAAFEAALRESDPEARLRLLQSSFERLLDDNTSQALAQIERIPNDERESVVSLALARWAERQPQQAQRMLQQELPRPYQVALLSALAERDPHQALGWLTQADRGAPSELYRAILPALLRDDVNAAARTIAGLRAPPLDLIQQVAGEYAKHDPSLAFAWTATLTHRGEHERIQALHAVGATIVATDRAAAVTYLERATDPDVRSALLRSIAGYTAQTSVRDAFVWLSRYRGDPSYRENARALLSQWSYAKPEEVAQAVLAIDDVEFQRAAAEQLAAVWRERDQAAFLRWVASLAPGTLRDALANTGS